MNNINKTNSYPEVVSNNNEIKYEIGRQQHILVSKRRYLTFSLSEICSLLEQVMIQQGDESIIIPEEIDWNLIASNLDKDQFEIEYFWRNFNPNIHFKPTLGYAIVPLDQFISEEPKLLYNNIDHQSNIYYNFNLLNELNSKNDCYRIQTTLNPIIEFMKNKAQLLHNTFEYTKSKS